MKDTSLRVPPGMDGTVIDVRVFTRDGVEKDARALSIEKSELEAVRKDLDDTLRILEEDIYERVERMLTGKMAQGGPNKLKSGAKITKGYLEEVPREQWFEIRLKNDDANEQLQKAFERLKAQRDEFDRRFEEKKSKITAGDVTVTRASSRRSFRSKTCPISRTARPSISCSTRWVCRRA